MKIAVIAIALAVVAVSAVSASQLEVDMMANEMVGTIDATPVVPVNEQYQFTRPGWSSFLEMHRPDGNEHKCEGGACAWGGSLCCAGGKVCCPPGFACQVGNPPRCGLTQQQVAVKIAKKKAFEEGEKQKEKMAEEAEKEEEKEKAHAKKKAEQLEKQNAEQKKKAEELQKQQEKAKHEEEVKTAKQKAEEAKKESARKEEEEEKQNEEKAKKQQEKVKLEQHEKQIADGKAKAKQEELQKKINEDNMKKKAKADAIRAERTSKRRERHHKHELHHKAVVRRHQAHLAEQRRKAANRVHFLRGWRHYGGSYRRVEAKRYGPFCILSGLARRGAYRGPIMRLPTWCRPVRQTMHAVFAAGGRNERFDITSSGVVYWQYGLGHSSWTPMDSMMFTIRGQRMHNLYLHGHYHNYGGAYERAKWTKYGDWCQLTGLIRARSPIVHNRYLARVPPACYPHARLIFDAQHHYESVRVDLLPNGWIVAVNVQRSHGVRWISLNNIGYFTNRGHNLHMVHGWHPYHHSYRSPAWKRQGNFCAVSGLMRGNHWGGVMFVLPAQCRPNRRLIFMCNNHGGRYPNVRLDVLRDGRVVRAGGGHSHGWISLNAIRFLRR